MIQTTLPVGKLQCNCQILVCPRTYQAVLVDPGDEPERIIAVIEGLENELKKKIEVKALFHTHAHFDHISGTRGVVEHFSSAGIKAPSIYLHKADEFMYQMLPKQAAMFGFEGHEPLPVDQFLSDEETLTFGELKFTVLHTPGHSPGGVCFRLHQNSEHQVAETVFTGDTLFRRGVGRSDLWGGESSTLLKSIKQRLFSLDDDTCAWPGHGPSTSIGEEKRENPYL
ncbi:MAG: MBL fold metallo-hydrolase [Bdellovibrionales bacterium]|nr:MBL fold metallo-hydrolase [Oligoflexia bacterium]